MKTKIYEVKRYFEDNRKTPLLRRNGV